MLVWLILVFRFIVVNPLNSRISKRTLNPPYSAKDATFDFRIFLLPANRPGVIDLVVWDKDVLKKVNLDEVAVPV